MAYYTALIAAWNSVTQPPVGVAGTGLTGGMSTAQKIDAVNGWTITGAVPTTANFSGVALINSINYTEFKNLTATQQQNILMLCGADMNSGALLGGSANTVFLPVGLIIDYFTPSAAITSGTYNSATGVVTLVMSATIKFGPGGNITMSGLTGTGAFASLNGIFPAIAPTSGTTVTYQAASGLGATTITGGSVTPPTVTALTAMAKGLVQPWWQAANGGALNGPVSLSDTITAGLS
jgi:hypothetical protein